MNTLAALFTSQVRAKALRRLILAGAQEAGERVLAREERLPLGALRRELARLGAAGLVRTRLFRRRRFYRANTAHPYYPELKAFFLDKVLLWLAANFPTLAPPPPPWPSASGGSNP